VTTRRSLRFVIVCLLLAMTVTSCGQRSSSSTPAPAPADPIALDRAHTALLVMDMQQAIVGLAGGAAQEVLKHTAATEHASRDAGVSVVFVETAFAPGYPEVSPRNKTFANIAGTGKMIEGRAEARLNPRIAPLGDEPVIVKHEVGGFSAPPLEKVLHDKKIDTVVMTGLATSGVVLATAEAAADLDYRVIVLSDCVADSDPQVNRLLLDKVLPIRADVIDSAQYMGSLHP
jgi:nicotinamidase-related amidase